MGRDRRKRYRRILRTGLFDAAWYHARNPGIPKRQDHLLSHYLTTGWREGADPSPHFDGAAYLATHPDVAAAGINPLLHYAQWGEAEGREFHPVGAAAPHAAQVAFSLILATYNRAAFIERAIDAVLAQTHRRFELIIVDDGSTDGTEERLRARYRAELAAGRLVYVGFSQNLGVSSARNAGLVAARHPWIAYVDSDNAIRPHFLATFARRIVAAEGVRTFYARMRLDSAGDLIGTPFSLDALRRVNTIDIGVFVHHIACFHALGGFDASLQRLVDWDLILKFVQRFPPVYLPDVLLEYCDRDGAGLNRITSRQSLPAAATRILRRYGGRLTVTTVIICYNQKAFIAQAIESALAQEGDFFHEIVIADDGSTDGTADIARAYRDRYPHAIRLIGDGVNRGISANFRRAFAAAGGEFLAVLEGDDYWTDPAKLALQIGFLRAHADCAMVFSRIEIETPGVPGRTTLPRQDRLYRRKLTGAHFLAEPSLNLIANFSCCLFRTDAMQTLPALLFDHRLSEIALAFHLERQGRIGYIRRPMSVYRQHPHGVWSGASPEEQRASGRLVREAAKAVARDIYKPALQAILDARYPPA